MKISNLTFLGFYLNIAISSGRYERVSIDAVKTAIERGTIFDYLEKELGEDIDLSIYAAEARAELLEEWQGLANAVEERRKYGLTRGGLNLLLAYVLEGVQQRARKAGA